MRRRAPLACGALLLSLAPLAGADAQRQGLASDSALANALAAWTLLDAPTGVEELSHRTLLPVLGSGWRADRMGNLVRRVGSGAPRRVVACAMDVPSLNVSAITDDGYLRLHRAGTPSHPLWDQFHEAQRVRVLTRRGEVAGVVAVPNGHFARQHRGDTLVVNVDNLWVDIGASTRAQAESLGVTLLDPVLADRPAWTVGSGSGTFVAGPASGARAGCAAVATAARIADAGGRTGGETIFVLSTQRAFGWVGLAGVLARLGRVDSITLFDTGAPGAGGIVAQPARNAIRAIGRVMRTDSIRVFSPSVRHAGSLVEAFPIAGWLPLLRTALGGAGIEASPENHSAHAIVAPPLDTVRTRVARRDAYDVIERQFAALADLPGVPGHEGPVRAAIRSALPAWARERATVDSLGNLIVSLGPDRDSVAFVAHMDEVAFEIEGIARDGTVRLGNRGGVVLTAWEGQPALLHFDAPDGATPRAPMRGVFVPRDTARVKSPRTLTAWFGVDSAALVAQGVRVGQGVTAYKRGARLAGTRFTARGSDDRTGSTALLLALQRLDPASLDHKVLFVWSTREETGLTGASYFGAQHGRSLTRVYSVDTFVSSDTPLELPTFALTPLGRGPVLRMLDDGSIVPRTERERIQRIARLHRIPLQLGTTHGATDGSAIAAFGAPNVGLSWPGRYSHSPAEILDLRDVDALIRLIAEVAKAKR